MGRRLQFLCAGPYVAENLEILCSQGIAAPPREAGPDSHSCQASVVTGWVTETPLGLSDDVRRLPPSPFPLPAWDFSTLPGRARHASLLQTQTQV